MEIAVLGAGNIGGTLGKKWALAGHTVTFGVRQPDDPKLHSWIAESGAKAQAATLAAAIERGEVVLFAIPGPTMEAAIQEHAQALHGKIIIDAANKVGGAVMNSLEAFARYVPTAQVFRAFNNIGWENFEDPRFGDLSADLLYCGPDGPVRASVEQLIGAVGLRPVWLGGPEQAGLVDAVTRLWFTLANGRGMGRHLAFKVLF